jgi:hypothetical protein
VGDRKIRRPSHATIVAYVALFAALGGTATALSGRNSVRSNDIRNGQVKVRDLATGAVTTPKLAPGAVNAGKVARASLTGANVADDSLTGEQINESSLNVGARIDTTLLSHFDAPDSFATPTGFGPVSGISGSTGSEAAVTMLSPDVNVVAQGMNARFDFVSPNSARRLTLRVDQTDTALTCTVGSGSGNRCGAPAGTTVPVPAGSILTWEVDDGGAPFTTDPTGLHAIVRLVEP